MTSGWSFRESRAGIESELAARICVRPPYFALRNVAWSGDEFSAVASAEFPSSPGEVGPMRAAELGRHGAIAGLCALAMTQADSARRYYLASTAIYKGSYSRASYGSALGFVARVEELNKRTGRATVSATDLVSGETVMDLSVGYLVLSEAMFERLYRGQRQPTEASARLAPLQTARVSPGVRSLAAIPSAPCAGHFDNYPALPLAIVLSELVEISSELVGMPHWVREARVEARDLCWAGQPVRFESLLEVPSKLGVESSYHCRSLSGATVCAEMRLILAPPADAGA